jgi:O-antigen biosynthesis protein
MRFEGKNQLVIQQLFKEIKDNFTYEFWVKPTATHQLDNEEVWGVSGLKGQRYAIGAGHADHQDFAGIGVSIGTNGISVYEHTVNHLPATLVFKMNIADWIHVAIVYIDKVPYLYMNGELKRIGLKSKKTHVFPSGILGGLEPYGYFVGDIREFRLWDHPRSMEQIKLNLNRELTGKEKGLFKYINFQKSSFTQKLKMELPEQSKRPLVSIIIPAYNQWNYTMKCIESIKKNTMGIEYEVIIADDASDEENLQKYDSIPNLKVIRDGINRGFLKNCNHAAKQAQGKYLVLLNNDTVVQKDWLKYLLELIQGDNRIGMVGPKLLFPNGKLQEAGGIIWSDASGWNYGRNEAPEMPEYCYVKEVDYISGACMMIRASIWGKIGGFDCRYSPAYYEDTDLAFEVRNQGYKVMYQPKSIVIHYEGISHGTDLNSGVKKYQTVNQKNFLNKWKHVLENSHFVNGENLFNARDRSKGKKTILVIDHYVPTYDKDAGSRTIDQYMKLLLEMGLNVKFVGDNFAKPEPYTSKLQQLGIEVFYGPWYSKNIKEWIKENGNSIDYVFFSRPHITIKYLDWVKLHTDAKLIYYGHDLHYLRCLREYNLFKKENLLEASNKWKGIENQIFQNIDVVYSLSQLELDEIKKQHSSLKSRKIPVFIYDHFEKMSTYKKENLLFVGGFNHSPNVDAVIWFVKYILPKITDEIPDIKFYIVGSNPPNEIRKLASANIIVTGDVTDDQLKSYYNQCRLVVVPLRYGAGVKGKILEAMYHQVPIITTSVGAEGYVNHESLLTVANEPDHFANQVVSLYKNTSVWEKISKSSLEYVKNYFSKEVALRILLEDIKP